MKNCKKGSWFSPIAGDTSAKKDLQKKYSWFSRILYNVLLVAIGGYLLMQTIKEISLFGPDVFSIVKIVIWVILLLIGIVGVIEIGKNLIQFKNSVFYIKTCRIVDVRGEKAGKRTYYYVTIQNADGTTVEYESKNNPWLSEEQIAAKKEITIVTFEDVSEEEDISTVFVLDNVYPEYRNNE